MTDVIETHRQTALDSPYSRDREEAIEELARVYPDADSDGQRRALETLRQVAIESPHRQERSLAREALVDCFEHSPAAASDVVVSCFIEIAQSGRLSEERCAAIDRLRTFYPDVDNLQREQIGQTLADIAGNGTYEDERRRARQRLTDIAADERSTSAGLDSNRETPRDMVGYLGQTLAENLANAAEDSPETCRQRAEEVRDFLRDTPVDDESYEAVRDDVEALVDQLKVVPTDGTLDEDRIQRVRRLAIRVENLYGRSG